MYLPFILNNDISGELMANKAIKSLFKVQIHT